MMQVIDALQKQNDEEKIELFRKDYIKTLGQYTSENVLRIGYLILVAKK